MARRLLKHGHEVVAFDRNAAAVAEAAKHGAIATSSFAMLAEQLPSPAIYWIMLPAGEITENTIEIAAVAKPGDIVIDGGNSFWKDDIRRSKLLAERGIPTSMSVCPAASGAWREAMHDDRRPRRTS